MVALATDHLLTGNDFDSNLFKHWDEDGVFIEDIDFSAYLTVYDPGYTVTDAWPFGFAQYGSSVYVLVWDFSLYSVVLEFDSSLAPVRAVGRVLDPTDLAQNPDEVSDASFIAPADIDMDPSGNIYIGSAGTGQRPVVFKYANDGSFVSRIVTEATNPSTPCWAVHPTSSELYLNEQKFVETIVVDDERTVILERFDQTGVRIASLDVFTNPDTPAPQFSISEQDRRGCFDGSGNYYMGATNQDVFTGFYAGRAHVIDPSFSITSVLLTMPTGTHEVSSVRPIADSSHLWITTHDADVAYMFQALTSDGSLIIDKIQIADDTGSNGFYISLFLWKQPSVFRRRVGFTAVIG